MKPIKIGNHWVGGKNPCYIVAEVSCNHHRSFEKAVEIIKAAKEAGADAVKWQTYTPKTMTLDCDLEWFKIPIGNTWAGKSFSQLYSEAFTPWEWFPELQKYTNALGLDFFSTPFDFTAVDFLETLNVPVYKIASFEIVDIQLLKRVAKTRKPTIVSTGMASLGEIEEAVKALRNNGSQDIILLKCTSSYPASPEEMNLRTIPNLSTTFEVLSGLSDHTLGIGVAIAAVALGASIVEKHFILSRDEGGPDSSFSMEPGEFADLVFNIRQVEKALGGVSYERNIEEEKNLCFRRSLFVVQDIKEGKKFTESNIRSIRPGYGLLPRYFNDVIGKFAACDIKKGTPVTWDLIKGKG